MDGTAHAIKIYFDFTDESEAEAPATGEWKIRPVEGNPGWFIIVREEGDGTTTIISSGMSFLDDGTTTVTTYWLKELAEEACARLNEEAEK